jgi:hypothetical protein
MRRLAICDSMLGVREHLRSLTAFSTPLFEAHCTHSHHDYECGVFASSSQGESQDPLNNSVHLSDQKQCESAVLHRRSSL